MQVSRFCALQGKETFGRYPFHTDLKLINVAKFWYAEPKDCVWIKMKNSIIHNPWGLFMWNPTSPETWLKHLANSQNQDLSSPFTASVVWHSMLNFYRKPWHETFTSVSSFIFGPAACATSSFLTLESTNSLIFMLQHPVISLLVLRSQKMLLQSNKHWSSP